MFRFLSPQIIRYYIRITSDCSHIASLFSLCALLRTLLPAPSLRLRVWHVVWILAQGLFRVGEQGPPVCSVFYIPQP